MQLAGPICQGVACLWMGVVLIAPFVAAGAVVVLVLVRFAYRRRTGRRLPLRWSAATFVAALVVLPACVYAYLAVTEEIDARRAGRLNAQALDFDLYVPSRLPPGYELDRARAFGGALEGSAEFEYVRGDDALHVVVQAPPGEVVTPGPGEAEGRCRLFPLHGVSSNFYEGACRRRVAPSGRVWFEGGPPTPGNPGEATAFVVRDRALIVFYHPALTRSALEVLVDSLERRRPEDMEFRA